jgi:hypothetical protein
VRQVTLMQLANDAHANVMVEDFMECFLRLNGTINKDHGQLL